MTTLTAILRMKRIRAKFKKQRLNAIKIQSHFRMYRLQKFFLTLKRAIIAIQRRVRCYQEYKRFQKKRLSAIKISSVFRGYLAKW